MVNWPVANNLSAGTYTVTVTDANICEAVQTVAVDEPTPVIATIISSEDVSCHGDNDGTATVDVTEVLADILMHGVMAPLQLRLLA